MLVYIQTSTVYRLIFLSRVGCILSVFYLLAWHVSISFIEFIVAWQTSKPVSCKMHAFFQTAIVSHCYTAVMYVNQYPSFTYTKNSIYPYAFPIAGLRFFCKMQELRNPTTFSECLRHECLWQIVTFLELESYALTETKDIIPNKLFALCVAFVAYFFSNEPVRSISCKTACVPSEDSDQPSHPSSLIRVFARHSLGSQGSKASSGGNAQADRIFTGSTCNSVTRLKCQ